MGGEVGGTGRWKMERKKRGGGGRLSKGWEGKEEKKMGRNIRQRKRRVEDGKDRDTSVLSTVIENSNRS